MRRTYWEYCKLEEKINLSFTPPHLRFLMNRSTKAFIDYPRLFGVFTNRINKLLDMATDQLTIQLLINLLEDFEDKCGAVDLVTKQNQIAATSIIPDEHFRNNRDIPKINKNWYVYRSDSVIVKIDFKDKQLKNLISKIEDEIYRYSYEAVVNDEITRTKLAKVLGVSIRTIMNRFNYYQAKEGDEA